MKAPVAVFASILLALPAAAQFCDLNLRYEEGQLRWTPIVGAESYTVIATYGSVREPDVVVTEEPFLTITRRASGPVDVRYTVTALVEPGVRLMAASFDACTSSLEVTLPPDAEFRKFARRVVLPIAGSTTGLFGAKFRTALILRGAGDEKGRIVFHPAGRAALDTDPSMPYSFLSTRVLTFEDVLAAMGTGGIGSLEIIPDDDSSDRVPRAEVRLYNETELGTFGTFATPVLPSEYTRPQPFEIRIPDERFRVNIGILALKQMRVQILIYNAENRLSGLREKTFPAGWMEMKSASEFMERLMLPGERLLFAFDGAAVPFYTVTENATNDPTLILGPSRPVPTALDQLVN